MNVKYMQCCRKRFKNPADSVIYPRLICLRLNAVNHSRGLVQRVNELSFYEEAFALNGTSNGYIHSLIHVPVITLYFIVLY